MTTKYYINQYGVKTSKKLDKIVEVAYNYMYNGSNKSWSDKLNTKKIADLRFKFEKEVEAIGGVDYEFGDTLC